MNTRTRYPADAPTTSRMRPSGITRRGTRRGEA